MKIIEHRQLGEYFPKTVHFFRIDPENLSDTLTDILEGLKDLSWLNDFDHEFERASFRSRALGTIELIEKHFNDSKETKLKSEAGEYVVSVLARDILVSKLNYLKIPLGELLGKKVSGNHGFDFHSQNNLTNTIIFGEAKYVAKESAYGRALEQIEKFIKQEKDIRDLLDLRDFCTKNALSRAHQGIKGFAAAFSAKSTKSDRLIKTIVKREDFRHLLNYEEVILIAVNL